MHIPVIIEPAYQSSVWCERTMAGLNTEIARKKYNLRLIDGDAYTQIDYDTLFGSHRRMLIVIGTSVSWIPRVIDYFGQRGIGVILVSYQPPEYTSLHGVVRMDYVSAMHMLMQYLRACGRPRIALYGFNPNSSADRIKQAYFCSLPQTASSLPPESHVFTNYGDLSRCFEGFRLFLGQYDAVICANDIVAVSLVQHLRQTGVPVPEALFVTCFGDSRLTEMLRPTITTASLDHVEMGRQAIALYSHLYRQPTNVGGSIRVASRLQARESTQYMEAPPELFLREAAFESTPTVNFYDDPEVSVLCALDSLLSSSDELDLQILSGLLAGTAYEQLAETLNTTASTLRYRLRRMLAAAGVETREALLALFDRYPIDMQA